MAYKEKKAEVKLNKKIDAIFDNLQNKLEEKGLLTNESLQLITSMRNYLKMVNGPAFEAEGKEGIKMRAGLKRIKMGLNSQLWEELGEKEYGSRLEKLGELLDPTVKVESLDEDHMAAGLMAEALMKYDTLKGEEEVFREGSLNTEKHMVLASLLAMGIMEEGKITVSKEAISKTEQKISEMSGYPRAGKVAEKELEKGAVPKRVRPPAEGEMRGHVGRKRAGDMRYPHDYWEDRGAQAETIEDLEKRIERAEERLEGFETVLKEHGILISPAEAKALEEKYGTDRDKWRELDHKVEISKTVAEWKRMVEELKGKSRDELEADMAKYRGMTEEILQVGNLKMAINMAKRDAKDFNSMYEGEETYFQTITPEWMTMMRTLTERIDARKGAASKMLPFFREVYGAMMYQRVEKLDVKLESIVQINALNAKLQQIYAEIGGNIGDMEYGNFPVTSFLDPDTGEVTIPQISYNDETGEITFPEGITKLTDSNVTGNRAMALRSLEDFEHLMDRLFRDPATKPLAERFFRQFYSSWHTEFLGRKKMGPGQEYKYLTESIRKLVTDSDFIAERQVLTRVLGTAELKIVGPRGQEPQILDNEEVVENFMGLSLETQYEILQLARKVGSAEGMNPEVLASIAIFINNLEGHSPAYSPLLVKGVGEQLVTQFAPDQVNIISNYILTFENVFVQTGQYADLQKWYLTLPNRMNELFTTIRDLMKHSREPGRDVRVRMPSEEDWVEIYHPAARLVIQVPKHTYYEWAAGVLDGMPDNASVRAMIAPDLREGIKPQPSSIITEQRFFEQGIVYADVLKPYPFIRIPITVENLGALAPDIIPQVGPWHQFRARAASAYAYQGDFGEKENITNLMLGEEAYLKGLGKEARQAHLETIAGDVHTSQGRVQARHIDDISVGEGNTLWNVDADYRVVHSTEEDEETIQINSLAPAGADTAITFHHEETADGVDRYYARIYQRFENGVFVEMELKDLEPEEARSMYDNLFRDANEMDVVRRIYGETGVTGTGGDKTILGDWRTSLDGCVLFAGNDDNFMVEETTTDEDGNVVVSPGAMFQGIGGSLEKYNAGGGFMSYEHTRQGRGVAGGGKINADERSFAIGRIFGKNFREPVPAGEAGPEEAGMAEIPGQEEYMGPSYTDVEVDMWLLKDKKYNFRAFVNTLGMAEGGARYGALANYVGNGYYVGGTAKGLHDKGEWAGSAYGAWGREMANAVVASTLVQTSGTDEHGTLGDIAAGAIFAINSNMDLQGIVAYHQDLEGNMIEPRQREEGAKQFGSMAKWIMDPVGPKIARLELLGVYYQRTEEGMEEPAMRGGMAGGAIEWEGPVPGTAEAYFPGVGEVKLDLGNVDVVAGGGKTMFDSYGGHAGVRLRAGRLTLFGVGAVEEEGPAGDVSEGADRARILDGMAGFRFLLSEPESMDQWRHQIFGGISGIVEQFRDEADPFQVGGRMGWIGSDAFRRLTASAGMSHWEYMDDWTNRHTLNLRYDDLAHLGKIIQNLYIMLSIGAEWTKHEGGGGYGAFEFGFDF